MSKKRKHYLHEKEHEISSTKKRKLDMDETAEERRERRLNKRASKQKKIKLNERDNYFGYSNEDNPFGDSNLTSVFIWKKKYEKQGLEDKQIKNIQKQKIIKKQQMLKSEILKTKERRKQREKDKEIEEKLHAELAKEMELEENAGWKEKEEEFHQLNAIKRSQIRIIENRYKPIDILAINIMQFKIDSKHYNKIENPIELINNSDLELEELALLLKEINIYINDHLIGTNNKQIIHWKNILIYTQYMFDKKNLVENYTNTNINNEQINNMNIMEKIERENLSKHNYNELIEFEQLCNKMVSGKANEIDESYANISIDVNYWTLALKIAKICKAKSFILNEYKIYINKLKIIKPNDSNSIIIKPNTNTNTMFSIPELLTKKEINNNEIPMINNTNSMYKIYKNKSMDYDEYYDEIEELRIKVLKQTIEKFAKKNNNNKNKLNEKEMDKKEQEMYNSIAIKENETGEHSYNKSEEIIPLELRKQYLWHDKYRPRKPRYFNRVKTGYSWNKYNQTHYDPDNPPPKIVQGYKFNIFYPDLIDPSQTPTYKLYEKDNNNEYAILIFHSGPPYQDIAFKIVNNEIEPSHRRGFRCRFERGIFSLYFNFKRYRYRR